MSLIDSIIHPRIRGEIGKRYIQWLNNNKVNVKDISHTFYKELNYDNETVFVCSIKDGKMFHYYGFIFNHENKFIDETFPYNMLNYVDQIGGIFLLYRFRRIKKIRGKVFILMSQHQNFYGDWMHDIISRIFLLKDANVFNEIDYFIVSTKCRNKFYKDSLNLFGIDESKLLYISEEEILCENLFFTTYPRYYTETPPKWVCDKYLNFTKELLKSINVEFYDKIYISRKKVKTRNIINEKELIKLIEPLGYKIIYPEDYSIAEQFCIFNKAKKIISVLGSGLTNIVCCDKNTSLLGIVAYIRYEYYHKEICDTIGMKYFEYIEEDPNNILYHNKFRKSINQFSFKIDLDLFSKVLFQFDND
ncbi:DUF563 domain-containing protein [Brachyspira sp. SAP_772]|uniref:glycosyltransferase family 61 protein n=1 Tax=Brachyspira sp. SAP_772 TaxID=2608385 RepID=UPI0012F4F428|nr:glycosyltransferase family 61 protein [Brachyspira sp. SAP_772]